MYILVDFDCCRFTNGQVFIFFFIGLGGQFGVCVINMEPLEEGAGVVFESRIKGERNKSAQLYRPVTLIRN